MGEARTWYRSKTLALVAAVLAVAAAVERLAPISGAIRLMRGTGARPSAPVRIGGPAYPRTAVDADDFTVRIARPARRIVSQYWSIDEFVYKVAPEDRIVGVSQSAYLENLSNVLEQVKRRRPEVAADPERVLRLNPDLVLVASSARADYTALVRSTGAPTYRMFTVFTTLDEIAESIRLVGYLTGEDEAAEAERRRFMAAVERARHRRPASAPRPRVFGLAGRTTYGRETLFHDVVETLGAINVGAEAGLRAYESVSTEQVLRWNPEWIVAGADRGKTKAELERLMADPAIGLTQAARNGRILVLEYQMLLPASPFVTATLDVLGEALYGR
jgi:iron complex transport system substrate-binding protein